MSRACLDKTIRLSFKTLEKGTFSHRSGRLKPDRNRVAVLRQHVAGRIVAKTSLRLVPQMRLGAVDGGKETRPAEREKRLLPQLSLAVCPQGACLGKWSFKPRNGREETAFPNEAFSAPCRLERLRRLRNRLAERDGICKNHSRDLFGF